MVIFGVKIAINKKIHYALTSIYGLGYKTVCKICNDLGLSPNITINKLTEAQIAQIIKKIKQEYLIEGNLRKNNRLNLRRLVQTKSYRGFRHLNFLPVRGQRTSTNAKTQQRLKRSVR